MPLEEGPKPREVHTFAPGRVNLIGEHTDYNGGLALPFAITEGVVVRARAREQAGVNPRIRARALDLAEEDEFGLADTLPSSGWRAFVRGIAAELSEAGVALAGTDLEISGDLPRGAGLSSSAALEVAVSLALLGVAGHAEMDRRALARLCSRVESRWIGAETGLLDQLASLFGEPDTALYIDFSSLEILPVPLVLQGGWRLVVLDSGETRALAASGYNERRAECALACELLGVASLRELERPAGRPRAVAAVPPELPAASPQALAALPATLSRRVRHVLGENARVSATVAALRQGDLWRVGELLNESHASLRDLYECSTPAVDAAVERLRQAGAAGARLVGGGFGGSVLGLLPPATEAPRGSRAVRPSRGAHLYP